MKCYPATSEFPRIIPLRIHLNNKMLSSVVYTGYEGGDIACRKKYTTRVFRAMTAIFTTHVNHQRQHFYTLHFRLSFN